MSENTVGKNPRKSKQYMDFNNNNVSVFHNSREMNVAYMSTVLSHNFSININLF